MTAFDLKGKVAIVTGGNRGIGLDPLASGLMGEVPEAAERARDCQHGR